MKLPITCIIPLYNEAATIGALITELLTLSIIDQIICVNDGSQDDSLNILDRYSSQIEVLHHSTNQGKLEAIEKGLNLARHNKILFLDADMSDLNQKQLMSAVEIFNENYIDMLILKRVNDPWINRMLHTDLVISGTRLLHKSDLRQILKMKAFGYQFELACNDYMVKNRKKTYWLPLVYRDRYKIQKYGLLSGISKELFMWRQLLAYQGLLTYIKTLFQFSPNQWEH